MWFAGGRGELTRDARLDAVAGDLAAVVANGAALDDDGLVEFVMHAHGVIEPAARVIAVRGQSPAELVATATAQLGDSLFYGSVHVGIAGGIVMITHRALVTLLAVPRFVPAHGDFELEGVLDPGFHAPRVTITHDDRSVDHPAVTSHAAEFRAPFACGAHAGTQWVLIEGCDDNNVVYRLALVPISCGITPAATFRVEPLVNATTADLETRLDLIINRERAAATRLPLVVADPRARLAAITYAQTMGAAASVSHELGGTTPAMRMRSAGLIPPFMLEATLQAATLARASEILMNDPVYRADLVSPSITHVGVGVVRDAHGELYVAIELVQIAPAIDPVNVRQVLLDNIRASSPMGMNSKIDRLLQKLATRYARDLAAGWREDTLWVATTKDVNLAFARYKHAKKSTVVVLDPSKLDVRGIIGDRRFHELGIGVAQSGRNGALAGRIWVVVFFGERDEFLEHSRSAHEQHTDP